MEQLKHFVTIFFDYVQKHSWVLLLFLALLLILHPISFLQYPTKWDNINAYLPYRFFASFYLNQGEFPGWNPFQKYGYPAFADMQSAVWYPIFWIISAFGRYDIGSITAELLSSYVIAGLGMYVFSTDYFKNKPTAFLLALCYSASGFMFGSSQLLVFLHGYAWFPCCMYALRKLFNEPNLHNALLLAIVMALQTTSASPAYTIVLGYLSVAYALYTWIQKSRRTALQATVLYTSVSVLAVLLLLLPFLLSFYEFSPYMSRAEKLPYSRYLLSNPLPLSGWVTALFPYASLSNSETLSITDLSLRNNYLSILGLFAFGFGTLRFFSIRAVQLALLAILTFVLIAQGDAFSLYEWLYHLPGFGLFRHPAFFRGYVLFFALFVAGFWIREKLQTQHFTKSEKSAFLIFGAAILVVLLFSLLKTNGQELLQLYSEQLNKAEKHETGIYAHIAANAILILVFLLGFLWMRYRRLHIIWCFALLCFIDLAIQAKLSAASTLHYPFTYESFDKYFEQLPTEIDQTKNYTPLGKLNESAPMPVNVAGIWINRSSFMLQPSSVAYNPTEFKAFVLAEESGSLQKNGLNPLIWSPIRYVENHEKADSACLWQAAEYPELESKLISINKVKIKHNVFSANIENRSAHPQWVILNQNYHHLWRAFIGDKELQVQAVNSMVMGVLFPENQSGKLQFKYETKHLQWAAIISMLTYAFITIALLFRFYKPAFFEKS